MASNSYFYDGVWGGYKKYVLTRQEVEYLDKAEITTLHDINQHFNCRIDLTYRGYHVAMLKGLYEKFRDYDTFEMYTRTHDVLPPEHFFANHKLSYIFGVSWNWKRSMLTKNIVQVNSSCNVYIIFLLYQPISYSRIPTRCV